MRTEGMPHSPKPPTASEAPFGMSATASSAFAMTLSKGSCFLMSWRASCGHFLLIAGRDRGKVKREVALRLNAQGVDHRRDREVLADGVKHVDDLLDAQVRLQSQPQVIVHAVAIYE